ncbi:hypothetical protein E2320_003318, partial [Naja naja]
MNAISAKHPNQTGPGDHIWEVDLVKNDGDGEALTEVVSVEVEGETEVDSAVEEAETEETLDQGKWTQEGTTDKTATKMSIRASSGSKEAWKLHRMPLSFAASKR